MRQTLAKNRQYPNINSNSLSSYGRYFTNYISLIHFLGIAPPTVEIFPKIIKLTKRNFYEKQKDF